MEYLESKPLYYKEIDYERMPRAYDSIKEFFKKPKLIHIIGTNGKGSSGRFSAHYLYKSGYSVGHYTSPHIVEFNERIWLNGQNVTDEILEDTHKKLFSYLNDEFRESLSYFEYTTLLAYMIFQECEYIVFEAGLGGEYDATAVFEKVLTLVTPIAYDHQSFLGNDIESIAKTKLNSIENSAILGKQIFEEVYALSQKIMIQKEVNIFRYDQFFTLKELKDIDEKIDEIQLASFFSENLALAISGLKFLGFEVELKKFNDIKIFGRFNKIASNIVIDVGHNPLAAQAILSQYKDRKIILIYNSYQDKEYKEILNILKPIIKEVQILPISHERVEQEEILKQTINSLDIPYSLFKTVNKRDEYLVFGSFSVVEEFLKLHIMEF
jgi:dihydrofolate synthase/folylpolyglutamate synthase